MKLENQVCSVQQAKRLSQLGIMQGLSAFFWDDYNGRVQLMINETPKDGYEPDEDNSCFSAFTVAELGLMIGRGTNAARLLHDAVQERMDQYDSFTIVLSPHFLAKCVIGMLETGRIIVEEVNQRLQAA